MAYKTILLKYQENRKKVLVPKEKSTTDLAFLEASFRSLFKFQNQVNLDISFQRYDEAFGELVDLEVDDVRKDLKKLNVVVTPVLVTPPPVSWAALHIATFSVHVCAYLMQSMDMPEDAHTCGSSGSTVLLGDDGEDLTVHSRSRRRVKRSLESDSDGDDCGSLSKPKVMVAVCCANLWLRCMALGAVLEINVCCKGCELFIARWVLELWEGWIVCVCVCLSVSSISMFYVRYICTALRLCVFH